MKAENLNSPLAKQEWTVLRGLHHLLPAIWNIEDWYLFFFKCYMYTKVFTQLEIMTVTVNLNSINTNINQETTKSCVNFFGAVNIGWHEGNSRACNLEVNHKRAKTNLNSGNQQKVSLHLQNPVSIRSLAWGAFCCNYQQGLCRTYEVPFAAIINRQN